MKAGVRAQNLTLMLLVAGFAALTAGLIFSLQRGRPPVEVTSKGNLREELLKSSQDQKLEEFSLTGFDDTGKKAWNLKGNAAKIDPGQTVFLDENVTLKLKDATVIHTDHVQWSQEGGALKTDSPVKVDHENATVTGTGAWGRLEKSFIQLNRNIEMVFHQSAGKISRLTCAGPLKIYFKDNRMIFYRNVKVVDERGVLKANRMDVFFDPDQKKVTQIIAVGNVVIQRGEDVSRSQRATYTVATGAVRLEGNPEITVHKESSAVLDATLRN